jgi:hypothetical protein
VQYHKVHITLTLEAHYPITQLNGTKRQGSSGLRAL